MLRITYVIIDDIFQVINGGSGKPSPTVAFPGVYTGNEPGILISKDLIDSSNY
jgi:hypothetical protein